VQALPAAFEEWKFTGDVLDHEDSFHDCELCYQQGLRYHFRIQNAETLHQLWIGSQCILKFNIAVFDERGQRMAPAEAKRKLDGLIDGMQHAACLKSLAAVAEAENNGSLWQALWAYKNKGELPADAAWQVLWTLQRRGIKHEASFFKVALREGRHKRSFRMLSKDQVHTIWSALTPSQRKAAMKWGYTPPAGWAVRPSRKMIGDAAKHGWTYGAMRKAGWSDALLRDNGYMQ
jgi:hypothetical protein